MTDNAPSPDHPHDADSERLARWEEQERAAAAASRDIADVPAVEVITTAAVHLMSAAAVKWLALIGSQVVRASTVTKTRAALPQTRPTPRI